MPISLNARRKFKDTPAGKIPVEWSCARIDTLGVVQSGKALAVKAPGAQRPYLRCANVFAGRIDDSTVLTMPMTDSEFARFKLFDQDVLLNEGQSLELVGRSAIYRYTGTPVAFQNSLIRFRPTFSDTSVFWHQLFEWLRLSGKFAAIASRTTSIAHLGVDRFAAMKVPVPCETEQRAIAALLDTWDDAIRLHEDRLTALTERKRGLMQRLLTGRTRLPGYAGKWKSFRLGSLLKAEDRYVDFDNSETYDLVSIRRRSGGVYFRETLSGHEIKTKVLKRIKTGDLLISRMQVVHGALGVVPAELDGMCASDSYEALVPVIAGQLDMDFMNCLSQSPHMWYIALRCSHGVHIEKMTFVLSDFLHEKVTIPADISEQRAIAAVLTACDEEIALTRIAADTLREQKRGLLQQLMTGRLRVPVKA